MSNSSGEIIQSRKTDHIRINLEEDVVSHTSTGMNTYYYEHQALPDINLDDVSLKQTIFQKEIKLPILISSMTGGTEEAWQINQRLAEVAQMFGLAMGLGSQRAALENDKLAYSFQVRKVAPDILLFANLGAIQLNYGYSLDECQKAIEMIEADGLILHLNPLQEALQPEGDTKFENLLGKIEHICKNINIPIIAKEVGWGISKVAAQQLIDAGVSAIDVAGAGGTSWAKVEMHRAPNKILADVAKAFYDWGIPTTESILNVQNVRPDFLTIASGGLKNGVDICKSISLGASMAGLAGKFLNSVQDDVGPAIKLCQQLAKEIQICMFATGSKDIAALKRISLKKKNG